MPEPNPRTQARVLLAALTGSSRRDRVAYLAGFVAAFKTIAGAIPTLEYSRLHAIADAMHDICEEEHE
jgi:hypothetical protein